ncbi:acyl-CoA thioesterase [Solimonas terrae]|uniref:Acyl-CoA thioesterase n=1 Tax=Solimonas terrae TaxID=1396819 RepID=A0A6M2BR59_9GAMM|nr:thioesterase family protein [Solimonas terrae]NGY04834.1 acyl-CoA thioesterase [Solimonas terrae]
MAPEAGGTRIGDYRYWVDERVRFNDLDLLGHVNNIAYVVYVETGRANFLRSIDMFDLGDRRQTVIVRFEIDYRREVQYPADLRVGVRVLAIGNSSFQIGVGIFAGETCVATARNAIVRWDRELHQAVALDDGERAALRSYLVGVSGIRDATLG